MAAAPAPEAAWYVDMVMRLMRRFWCSGHSGVAATMATQFGLAMMPLCFEHRAGVDLRHDQRHVGVHAERTTSCRRPPRRRCTAAGREALRLRAAGGEQRDVHAFEAVIGELLHGDVAAAEFHRLARRARGGQQAQLGQREFALLEALHELDADGAGGAGNGDDGILDVAFGLVGR